VDSHVPVVKRALTLFCWRQRQVISGVGSEDDLVDVILRGVRYGEGPSGLIPWLRDPSLLLNAR